MTKAKKAVMIFLVVALLLGFLWCYWEWPMTMNSLLPEENWVRAELRWCSVADSYYESEFENVELDRLLQQMGAVRLTRSEKRPDLDDHYFQINLYKGEPYPTMIYVGNTGRVQIARELDFDHWEHYEGGEDFYRWLESYSRTLPAVMEILSS